MNLDRANIKPRPRPGLNTYLYAPAVSCDEIHKEKRQMDIKSAPLVLPQEIQRYT
jgi:hypothetical protein